MYLDLELKQEIGLKVQSEVFRRIMRMNHEIELRNLLRILELEELLPQEITSFIPGRDVYVIGDTNVRKDVILQTFKKQGINTNRIKIILGYDEFVNFNFDTLRDELSIATIFVGPMPHSVKGKGSYTSIINKMEQEDGFPPVIRLISNNELKITRSNLKNAIIEEIANNKLDID